MVRGRLWANLAPALILAGVAATGAVGCGGSTHANGDAAAGQKASSFGGASGGSSATTGGRPADPGATDGGALAGTMSVGAGGSVSSVGWQS